MTCPGWGLCYSRARLEFTAGFLRSSNAFDTLWHSIDLHEAW
jgi:hypothetical protein